MHQDENRDNTVPSGGRSPERGTANKRCHFSAVDECSGDCGLYGNGVAVAKATAADEYAL